MIHLMILISILIIFLKLVPRKYSTSFTLIIIQSLHRPAMVKVPLLKERDLG